MLPNANEFGSEILDKQFPNDILLTNSPNKIEVIKLMRKGSNLVLQLFSNDYELGKDRSFEAFNSKYKMETKGVYFLFGESKGTKYGITDTTSEFVVRKRTGYVKLQKQVRSIPNYSITENNEKTVFFELLNFTWQPYENYKNDNKEKVINLQVRDNKIKIHVRKTNNVREIMPGQYVDATGIMTVKKCNDIKTIINLLIKIMRILSIFSQNPIRLGNIFFYEKNGSDIFKVLYLRSYEEEIPFSMHKVLVTSSRKGNLKPKDYLLSDQKCLCNFEKNIQIYCDSLINMDDIELEYLETFLIGARTNISIEKAIVQYGIVLEVLNNKIINYYGEKQNKLKSIRYAYKKLKLGYLSRKAIAAYNIRNDIVHYNRFKVNSREIKRRHTACNNWFPRIISSVFWQAIKKQIIL